MFGPDRIETQLHAVGVDRQREVAASIDDDANLAGAIGRTPMCRLGNGFGMCEQRRVVEVAFAHLNPIDSRPDSSIHTRGQIAANGTSVRHQAQDGMRVCEIHCSNREIGESDSRCYRLGGHSGDPALRIGGWGLDLRFSGHDKRDQDALAVPR
jgi:hypothetical protein